MNSLWKKEPNGTAYVDIFASINSNSFEMMFENIKIGIAVNKNKKNNEVSTKLRLQGNENFADNKWRMAMRYYNMSLRFAEIGTENVALAYANRSSCFLELGMFDKCITDIDMAIAANYPRKSKLETRRTDCLKQMKKRNTNEKSAPKLDFEADDGFHPGIANVLQMQYNKQFGRHFVAKRDIDVAKVILVEEAFFTTAVIDLGENVCHACFKHMNLVPCQYCTSGLFCDEICSQDFLHEFRCGRSSKDDKGLVEYGIRSIGRILEIFSTADELMNFVENVIQDPKKMTHVPDSLADMKSKYRLFLSLNLWLGTASEKDLIADGRKVFDLLMKHPDVKALFSSQKQQRFLMHLCVQHLYIVLCNSFGDDGIGGIFLLKNHFNHSCAPNVLSSTYENKAVCITSRCVKKGEQLFISYGDGYFHCARAERQKYLQADFGFRCECEKCNNKHWPISLKVIGMDQEFQYLANELDMNKINLSDGPKCAALKQKCLEILIKYCDLPWSVEKDLVANFYQHLSVETMN